MPAKKVTQPPPAPDPEGNPDRVRAGGWVLVDGVWQIEQK